METYINFLLKPWVYYPFVLMHWVLTNESQFDVWVLLESLLILLDDLFFTSNGELVLHLQFADAYTRITIIHSELWCDGYIFLWIKHDVIIILYALEALACWIHHQLHLYSSLNCLVFYIPGWRAIVSSMTFLMALYVQLLYTMTSPFCHGRRFKRLLTPKINIKKDNDFKR